MGKWKVREDLVVEVVDGECLILDLRQNLHFGLNAMGRVIWARVANGDSEEEILAVLGTSFPHVDATQLRTDLSTFLDAMQSKGLLLKEST